jgi:hypothetical protein
MLTTETAAWVMLSIAASSAAVRLILAVLAAHAARKALGTSAESKAAERLRAHRLAVLRALLNGLGAHRR